MSDTVKCPGATVSNLTYPGDTQGPDILAVGGGAVPCAPGPRQQAAQALDADAAVDGVLRRRRGPHQPGAGVVVPD